jgi:hypothetical protein
LLNIEKKNAIVASLPFCKYVLWEFGKNSFFMYCSVIVLQPEVILEAFIFHSNALSFDKIFIQK